MPVPPGGQATGASAPGASPVQIPGQEASPRNDLGGGMITVNAFWSVRVDRFERTANGALHVFVTIRSLRDSAYHVSPGSFEPVLLNGDGEGISNRGIYRASGDATEFSPLVPGHAEVRVRFVFSPAKGFGRALTFALEGDDSRRTNRPMSWPVPKDAGEVK